MAKLGSSSIVVTGLTASALAVVTMLALQAKSSATVASAGGARTGTVAGGPATAGKGGKGATPAPVAVPGNSGTGRRVVYSLGQRRVWLVNPDSRTAAPSFAVQPSAVSPSQGTFLVTTTDAPAHTGSDGVQIENVVLFASHDGVIIGFSSAVDGSMASPDPTKHTGGIRETVADGKEMYAFASKGTPVVVIG